MSNSIQKPRTVILAEESTSPIFMALEKVFNVLCPEFNLVSFDKTEDCPKDSMPPTGLIVLTEDSFFDDFKKLCMNGCWYMVVTGNQLSELKPWSKLSAAYSFAFENRCEASPFLLTDIIAKLDVQFKKEFFDCQPAPTTDICFKVCLSKKLYGYIEGFTHGGNYDISNSVLAPARILCLLNDSRESGSQIHESIKLESQIVEKFQKSVINKIVLKDDGELGRELIQAWETIKAEINEKENTLYLNSLNADSFSTAMDLLTEIRILSGKKIETDSKDSLVCNVERGKFRILLIDDHSEQWMPVFSEVQKRIKNIVGCDVSFEYSIDGNTLLDERQNSLSEEPGAPDMWQRLADYDLVLVDIFLPGTNGLEILKKIRDRVMWLPVLLWTSTIESDIPAQANLANGFLFKKKTTISEISDTIMQWLDQGRTRRVMALPNPFFDHVLVSEEIRKCAFDFTHWALKYVDSFHALDDTFFRFFNDHGGRHTIMVLSIVEKLLRPFFFQSETSELAVFSEDKAEREKEVLCLYVAVLCHEIGMFPMIIEGEKELEKYCIMGCDDLFHVRKQHCLRSLEMIWDKDRQSPEFSDRIFQLDDIFKNNSGKASVAALAGYHGRYLNLTDKAFCNLDEEYNIKALGKINEALKKSPIHSVKLESLEKSLEEIDTAVGKDSDKAAKTGFRGRLIRLCAVMRFADSLDINYTRVPADFLLYNDAGTPIQDRENAKRQVVEEVIIDRGIVSIKFNVKPESTGSIHSVLREYVEYLEEELRWSCDSKVVEDLQKKVDGLKKVLFAKDFDIAGNIWKPGVWKEKFVLEDGTVEELFSIIQESLDDWMDKWFFALPDRDHENYEKIRGLIPVIAAVSVLLEIYDEHKAVRDNGLAEIINLGEPKWTGDPRNLTIVHHKYGAKLEKFEDGKISEFKYLLPENIYADRVFQLIADGKGFSGFKITRQHITHIRDNYFDMLDQETGKWKIAEQGLCVRRRSIAGKPIFQVKYGLTQEGQYPQHQTYSFEKSSELKDFLNENKGCDDLSALFINNEAESIIVNNDRHVLQLQPEGKGKGVVLIHLDSFSVTSPSKDKKISKMFEIEIVGGKESLVVALEEELLNAFNLIKVRKPKSEKFTDAIQNFNARQKKSKIWLDMDTGVDDALALLLALRAEEKCEIVGISTVGGNVVAEQAAINTAKILKYAEPCVLPPIYVGCDGDIEDVSEIHGKEGIGDISEFVKNFRPPQFANLLDGFNGLETKGVTFVATGPLTNLAKLMEEYPEKFTEEKIDQIVIMGGVFWEPGNRTSASEFNIYTDPESARKVLGFCREKKIRHTFVPLDVTHRVVLKREDVSRSGDEEFGRKQFIQALTETYMDFYDKNQALDGCPMHDAMAVGYILWPELFVTDHFHVEICGSGSGVSAGSTIADFRPTLINRERAKEVTNIVVRVDRQLFMDKIKENLIN